MSAYKIVFIHGYTASSKADWYPTLLPELEKLGIDYSVPDLPGGEHPKASEWLDTLHNVIAKTDKPVVLVGHSLGSRTALLYMEKYQPRIKTVILIAAFANRVENAQRHEGKAYADFFTHKIDINAIKPLARKFIVMHSKDDDSIPYSQGVEIAKDLGAELITFKDRGHFSDPKNAPYILEVLKKELKF